MTKIKDLPCSKCGALLRFYFLKDGVCNACRNPHLVVTALIDACHALACEIDYRDKTGKSSSLYPEVILKYAKAIKMVGHRED